MSHRTFIALSALILLVAAALRLYDLPSYPPGPHYDEAVYLTMTRSIAFGGARFFPIVEAYQGREVLWMYLNAPLLSLFGDRVLTLRYASAFANLITLAACMGLARAMFPGKRGQLVALAAGAAFALSFPQVWLARQAFRAVTLPLCQALALWLLWRGLRADKRAWLWLTLAGFVAGSAIYTYMASRLFPLWLFIAAAAFVVWSWRAAKANRILQTPFQEPHSLIPSPSTGEGERAAETPPLHCMERGSF
ncbi:MAG: glycosyltransferase family 39 protein, partial [Chloroflexota bacterium]|nr:glycosyltransferase family 39 protein [Chloroflexota bacterium]